MYSPRQKILWFALSTRAAVIVIQAISNIILPDHDARVFLSPPDPKLPASALDAFVDFALAGFKRWDAQYFIHIAQYGYTYENCLAFFPLFPIAIRYLAIAMHQLLGGFLNMHSLLLVAAVATNVFCFVKSADVLYKLSLKVLRSESRAYKAAIMYCVNPASVFFTAPYSESMFAWFSFYGMLKCLGPETLRFTNIDMISSLPIGLSLVTRSNGLLNVGFILYAAFKNVIEKTMPEINSRYKTLKYKMLIPLLSLPLLASMMALTLTVFISLVPFVLVQSYNYFKFCLPHEHNLPNFLSLSEWTLPGEVKSPWCNSTFPLAYSYVQSHYWNVGFLKYYQWKQIPNFMLASPVIYIILVHSYKYFKYNRTHCYKLGLLLRRPYYNNSDDSKSGAQLRRNMLMYTIYDPNMFVYVVHAVCLTLFSLLFVHVQVTTRLISSASPVLYWYASTIINTGPARSVDQNTINEHFRRISSSGRVPAQNLSIANLEGVDSMFSKWKTFIILKHFSDWNSKFIKLYFLGYFVMGTICFSNFYPWT